MGWYTKTLFRSLPWLQKAGCGCRGLRGRQPPRRKIEFWKCGIFQWKNINVAEKIENFLKQFIYCCADRISVQGEHFRGSASQGVRGRSPSDAREFSKTFKKNSFRKLQKCIILAYFSTNLKNHALIFRRFWRNTQILEKLWERYTQTSLIFPSKARNSTKILYF